MQTISHTFTTDCAHISEYVIAGYLYVCYVDVRNDNMYTLIPLPSAQGLACAHLILWLTAALRVHSNSIWRAARRSDGERAGHSSKDAGVGGALRGWVSGPQRLAPQMRLLADTGGRASIRADTIQGHVVPLPGAAAAVLVATADSSDAPGTSDAVGGRDDVETGCSSADVIATAATLSILDQDMPLRDGASLGQEKEASGESLAKHAHQDLWGGGDSQAKECGADRKAQASKKCNIMEDQKSWGSEVHATHVRVGSVVISPVQEVKQEKDVQDNMHVNIHAQVHTHVSAHAAPFSAAGATTAVEINAPVMSPALTSNATSTRAAYENKMSAEEVCGVAVKSEERSLRIEEAVVSNKVAFGGDERIVTISKEGNGGQNINTQQSQHVVREHRANPADACCVTPHTPQISVCQHLIQQQPPPPMLPPKQTQQQQQLPSLLGLSPLPFPPLYPTPLLTCDANLGASDCQQQHLQMQQQKILMLPAPSFPLPDEQIVIASVVECMISSVVSAQEWDQHAIGVKEEGHKKEKGREGRKERKAATDKSAVGKKISKMRLDRQPRQQVVCGTQVDAGGSCCVPPQSLSRHLVHQPPSQQQLHLPPLPPPPYPPPLLTHAASLDEGAQVQILRSLLVS